MLLRDTHTLLLVPLRMIVNLGAAVLLNQTIKTMPFFRYTGGGPNYATQWHLLMAAGLILSIPPFIVFLIFQRYFVEGLALTGLKRSWRFSKPRPL